MYRYVFAQYILKACFQWKMELDCYFTKCCIFVDHQNPKYGIQGFGIQQPYAFPEYMRRLSYGRCLCLAELNGLLIDEICPLAGRQNPTLAHSGFRCPTCVRISALLLSDGRYSHLVGFYEFHKLIAGRSPILASVTQLSA